MNIEIERPDLRAETKEGRDIRRELVKVVEDINTILNGINERIGALEKDLKERR